MAVLERFSPFRELDLLDRRMRRLLSDFPFVPAVSPAADVYETEGELVVELEVPGYEEEELDIEVSDHTLVVKGEREEETAKDEKTLRLHERLESTFVRRFELPAEMDTEHVTATYRTGVLTLHVPKATAFRPRKIRIAAK
jgi:HSP20 family protein